MKRDLPYIECLEAIQAGANHLTVCYRILFLLVAILVASAVARAQTDPVTSKESSGPTKVAITIDDIPDHGPLVSGMDRDDISRLIIKALKKNGVDHAYGFTNGFFMDDHPEQIAILKDWLGAGYPLGNHTYQHPHLYSMSAQAFTDDIDKQDRLLETLAPFSPLIQLRHMFKYPFLDEGETLAKRNEVRAYLTSRGYRIAEVTIDYYDWAWASAYVRCVSKNDTKSASWLEDHVVDSADRHLLASKGIARLLFDRDIPQILAIHAKVFNALTLDAVLEHWRQVQSVQFISLEEALADPVYSINPNLPFDYGRPFLEQVAVARHIAIDSFKDATYSIERLNGLCAEDQH